jgi:hypothetical protein
MRQRPFGNRRPSVRKLMTGAPLCRPGGGLSATAQVMVFGGVLEHVVDRSEHRARRLSAGGNRIRTLVPGRDRGPAHPGRGPSVGTSGTRRGVEPTGARSNSYSISRRAPACDQVQAGRNSAASATRRNSRPPIHQIVVTCQCGIGASSHSISMTRSEVGTGSGMNTT